MRRLLSVTAVLLALTGVGCHESDIEPRSPLSDDWTVYDSEEPVEMMSQEDIPEVSAENPAPLPAEPPPSISLGCIGDEPLTQPEVVVLGSPLAGM